MTYNQMIFYIYAALIVLMSLIAFCTYCIDKKKAIKGQIRIKEKTLLGMAVLNGAVGAFIGRKVAHHKTDKIYFSITIYLSIICQAAVFALLLVMAITK